MFDFIREFLRDRRRSLAIDKAYELVRQNKFDEAAEIYVQVAAETLKFNELIYAGDCLDAFKCFLQGNSLEKAMEQARNALRVLSLKDWTLKYGRSIERLNEMIGELYLAGYGAEAETFAGEVNEQLKNHGMTIRLLVRDAGFKAALEGKIKLAMSCPQCGGKLPVFRGDSINCPYCGSFVKKD